MRPSLPSLTKIILICSCLFLAASGFAQTPVHIGFTLQGCRFYAGITLPDGSNQIICHPDDPGQPDDAYTNGNQGKGWAELGLVPFRLTTTAGNQGDVTTDYQITIAADYQDNTAGHTPGYDIISAVLKDPESLTPSDSSCTVTATQQIGPPPIATTAAGGVGPGLTGGSFSSIYEVVTLHQNPGSTCYWAWWQRLAVGSHLFNGSSLQSYLFQGFFQGGKETVPIPVVQCQQGQPNCSPSPAPQSISKDMSATSSGAGNTWSLTGNGPGNITANTCDPNQLTQSQLKFTITWSATASAAGSGVDITTHVYATNPSPSLVYAQVSDAITGTDGFAPAAIVTGGIGTSGIPVPANSSNLLIATDVISDPNGDVGTQYSDTATASYWDIFGNAGGTATASAGPIYPTSGSTANTSATINNQESITGSDINFSVDSENPADPTLGTFAGGYTEKTQIPTSFPQPLSWTSITQDATALESSGPVSITFNKSIYLPAATATTETLTDSSTLTTSDNVQVNMSPGPLTVMANAAPTVTLTITKNIDTAVSTDQTFTFHICKTADYNSLGVCNNTDEVVTPPTVTVSAGNITNTSSGTSLQPDNYTVTEDPLAGWTTDNPQVVNDAPDPQTGAVNCAPAVTFNNKIVNNDLSVSKTATPAFKRTYTWGITKSVDKTTIDTTGAGAKFNYTVSVTHDTGTDSNWTVKGAITVSNPNSVDFTGVSVSDQIDNGGSCSLDTPFNGTVPHNNSVQLPYTCTYGSTPSPTSFTNKAIATWSASYGTPHTSGSGTAIGDFSTATPTLVDDSVTVTDTFGGTLGTVSYTDPSPKLFQYSHTFTGDTAGTCTKHDNTATFTTDTTSGTGSDTKEVTVCVGADLTVSKTATVTKPTYTWSINKTVSPGGTVQQSGSVTLNYSVTASYSKSGSWTVTGSISVTNPNDWESITGINVSDSIDNNGSCSVTNGTNQTLTAKQMTSYSYTCTYSTAPSLASGYNTATATWTPGTTSNMTPDGTASGKAAYSFSPLTTGPTTVTITDAFNGGSATTLGVINALTNAVTNVGSGVTVTKTPPSFKFTYSHVVTTPIGTCAVYNNTATIVETSQTAKAAVTVCNTKTGALTMGFWQGPQGASVINNSSLSGSNCAIVIGYLKGYSPFSDLTATTCKALNTYIGNVVNVANSSGGGGLMLKGQMLATALTSFYSRPPNPLSGQGTITNFGNTEILLNPIKGTENVTSAFLSYNAKFEETVAQMLSDASVNWTNSKCSPSTGLCQSNPYAIKTILVYASDAFAYVNQGQANVGP